MSSFNEGKEFMSGWIRAKFKDGATCLDVGACDGNWLNRIGSFMTMDAVEIYQPNIDFHHLKDRYRNVWCKDIAEFEYDWYDLIIFGDVIEHMTVEQATKALEYAKPRCKEMIIAVPYLHRQGPIYGNMWEAHLQEDLTPELFNQRYPGFKIICKPFPNYAYYIKDDDAG